MIAFLLLTRLASADEPDWAGLAGDRLEAIGLDTPSVSELDHTLSAPIADGGWVRVHRYASTAEAEADFEQRVLTSVQVPLPELQLEGADQAVGDRTGLCVARSRNVILVVRSTAGHAGETAESMLASLVVEDGLDRTTGEPDGQDPGLRTD